MQPVIVSGFGINPDLQRQIGLPAGLGEHVVPGPQGDGLHGFEGLGRLVVLQFGEKCIVLIIWIGYL